MVLSKTPAGMQHLQMIENQKKFVGKIPSLKKLDNNAAGRVIPITSPSISKTQSPASHKSDTSLSSSSSSPATSSSASTFSGISSHSNFNVNKSNHHHHNRGHNANSINNNDRDKKSSFSLPKTSNSGRTQNSMADKYSNIPNKTNAANKPEQQQHNRSEY